MIVKYYCFIMEFLHVAMLCELEVAGNLLI